MYIYKYDKNDCEKNYKKTLDFFNITKEQYIIMNKLFCYYDEIFDKGKSEIFSKSEVKEFENEFYSNINICDGFYSFFENINKKSKKEFTAKYCTIFYPDDCWELEDFIDEFLCCFDDIFYQFNNCFDGKFIFPKHKSLNKLNENIELEHLKQDFHKDYLFNCFEILSNKDLLLIEETLTLISEDEKNKFLDFIDNPKEKFFVWIDE